MAEDRAAGTQHDLHRGVSGGAIDVGSGLVPDPSDSPASLASTQGSFRNTGPDQWPDARRNPSLSLEPGILTAWKTMNARRSVHAAA